MYSHKGHALTTHIIKTDNLDYPTFCYQIFFRDEPHVGHLANQRSLLEEDEEEEEEGEGEDEEEDDEGEDEDDDVDDEEEEEVEEEEDKSNPHCFLHWATVSEQVCQPAETIETVPFHQSPAMMWRGHQIQAMILLSSLV